MKSNLLFVASLFVGSSLSQGAILLNEIFSNPPGTDDTQEFFELRSTTGGAESLAGLYLLIIEGENAAIGTLDAAFDLGSFSTGSNGLFLWAANSAVNSISPNPQVGTTVNISDFAPDLENGTQTYLLVSGFTGVAIGTDLDTDNSSANGFTNAAWTSVVDALGVRDTTLADVTYGSSVGFTDMPTTPTGFDPEVAVRLGDGRWIVSDIAGTNPGGPYTFDALESLYADGTPVATGELNFDDVSPGSANPVPEPASALLGAIGLLGLLRRRR